MPTALAQLHRKQRVDTESVTQQQSLQVVKKILGTSLGYISLKTLKRGYSHEADKFLDWVETGIFDALNRQYLRAFILGIHLDPRRPSRLAECYTFRIAYPNGEPRMCIERSGEDREEVAEVWDSADVFEKRRGPGGGKEKEEGTHKTVTMGEVKKSVQQLLRRLILLTQTLKPLPDNRFITIKLYYYDDITPPDYEPPFFRPGSSAPEDRFAFETKPEKIQVGEVETTYHTLTLGIQTITDVFDIPDEDYIGCAAADQVSETQTTTRSESQPTACSQATQGQDAGGYSQDNVVENLIDVGRSIDGNKETVLWNAEEEIDEGNVKGGKEGGEEAGGREINQAGDLSESDKVQDHTTSQLSTASTVPLDTQHTMLNEFSQTEMGVDLMEPHGCDSDGDVAMSLAGEISPSDSASQRIRTTHASVSRCTRRKTRSQSQRPALAASSSSEQNIQDFIPRVTTGSAVQTPKIPEPTTPASGKENRLVDSTVNRDKMVTKRHHAEGIAASGGPELPRCDCGVNEDDGDMIQCRSCDTWGHTVCYGYLPGDPTVAKVDHTCYRCLKQHQEEDPVGALMLEGTLDLEALGDVALLRRAIYIVWEEGWPNATRYFAERLGLKISDARQLENRLKAEGFLAPQPRLAAKGGKGRGLQKNGSVTTLGNQNALRVVKNDETRKKKLAFFDPMLGLGKTPKPCESNHNLHDVDHLMSERDHQGPEAVGEEGQEAYDNEAARLQAEFRRRPLDSQTSALSTVFDDGADRDAKRRKVSISVQAIEVL
ncbi:HORMA domain-containing protein [Endogone sp. FLAS-F59071]|nr:HORMA domain-containing protein [Endogone sp. FLAS-F59071]|eukprot:RUS17094.1 HORMA domain-containing protein [Endogone sp. FLAS-F59071]